LVCAIAMGSTFCSIPEGWSLVGIKTRSDYRRQGLAAEVTSSLCSQALIDVPTVQLTVISDNSPAIALYEKLGFELKEERVWIDCGSGSKPFF
jgi:ribosomal protein S18 acetylase RimI-like enzyme